MSDSASSSASEGANDSETTKAYRASSRRRKKRNFNRQYGLETDAAEVAMQAESDQDATSHSLTDRKGKGVARASSVPPRNLVDTSATEESGDDLPVKVKKEEDKDGLLALGEDIKPDISRVIDSDSEGELSEDVSPLGDPAAYSAQIARRAARARGERLSLDGKPNAKAVKQEPTSPGPKVKREPSSPGFRMKQEIKEEDPENPTSTTPDLTRIDSSPDEDSDSMPDYSVNDPRYHEWLRRQANKRADSNGQVRRPAGFRPYQQRDAKPHFDVKSEQQAVCGSLVLGFNEHGHSVEIPAAINRFLRGYQRQGVKFFWEHYQKREGGLLGDDMGMYFFRTAGLSVS